MPQKILAIDLGSWSVKAVLLESSFRGFTIEEVHEQELRAGNPESKDARVVTALKELLQRTSLKADIYVGAVSGESAATRFVELPFSDARSIEQTLGGELADVLPFEIEDTVYDHTLVKKNEAGGSLSICAAAPKESVMHRLDIFQDADVDPRFLAVDVLQFYNLYTHFLEDDLSKAETPIEDSSTSIVNIEAREGGVPEGRLIVDIGHERTSVLAASPDGIAHARVVRAGGKDITEAISKVYQLDWADAEAGKHDNALLASTRHPATSDAAQRMSDVVSYGLHGLVRELRRTLQAIRKERRIRVSRIDLVGGGARILNLPSYLAEELNVPVAYGAAVEQTIAQHVEASRRPAFAGAIALALRAAPDEPVSEIDLRTGEFQYAGQMQNLRLRGPAIAGTVLCLLFLLVANTFAQYHVVGSRERSMDLQFCRICKEVVGREICEPKVCIEAIKNPGNEIGNFKPPERSAFRVAAEISSMLPKDLELLVKEMDITPERARVSGETTGFDAVDRMVSAFGEDKCYTEVKKGQLRKKSDGKGVEFQLSIRLGCSK